MPAGNICEEGLKRNSWLLIEGWQKGVSLSGMIVESWIVGDCQFFISSHHSPKVIFMGVLCAKSDEESLENSLKIAQKIIEIFNCKPIIEFPCFGEIYAKIVETETDKKIAFLSIIQKEIYLREKSPEKEKKLVEAIERFKKEKQNMPKSH
jgi:hypothetical protein